MYDIKYIYLKHIFYYIKYLINHHLNGIHVKFFFKLHINTHKTKMNADIYAFLY